MPKPKARRKRPPRATKRNPHPLDPEYILWRYECGSSVAALSTTERAAENVIRRILRGQGIKRARGDNASYYKLIQRQQREGSEPPDFYTWRQQRNDQRNSNHLRIS